MHPEKKAPCRVKPITLAHVLQRHMSCCPSHQGRESRPFQALWLACDLTTGKTTIDQFTGLMSLAV